MFLEPVGVFCAYLEAPRSHIKKNQNFRFCYIKLPIYRPSGLILFSCLRLLLLSCTRRCLPTHARANLARNIVPVRNVRNVPWLPGDVRDIVPTYWTIYPLTGPLIHLLDHLSTYWTIIYVYMISIPCLCKYMATWVGKFTMGPWAGPRGPGPGPGAQCCGMYSI